MLAPLLERAALAPHLLDDRAEPAVAPAGDALGQRGLGVVPLELDALARAAAASGSRPILRCSSSTRVLPEPLERRERLGHEPAHRRLDATPVGVLAPDLDAVAGQLGDAERVLVGLGGQPGEEVELHPPPALAEGRLDRAVEVFLADELVDDLAHAPGAGLGGEGEAGAARLLDLGGDADGEGVDPQAGQARRTTWPHVDGVVDDAAARPPRCPRSRRVDRRGERRPRRSRCGAARRSPWCAPGRPGARAPGRVIMPAWQNRQPRGAAPEDLDVEPVVHHLGERHELVASGRATPPGRRWCASRPARARRGSAAGWPRTAGPS